MKKKLNKYQMIKQVTVQKKIKSLQNFKKFGYKMRKFQLKLNKIQHVLRIIKQHPLIQLIDNFKMFHKPLLNLLINYS